MRQARRRAQIGAHCDPPTGILVLLFFSAASASVRGQTGTPPEDRVRLELLSSELDDPVGLVHAGDGSGRLFVVERPGRVRIVEAGGTLGPVFLDIAERVGSAGPEQGLLGLAFHPNFKGNGFFYVNYTDTGGNTKISRFVAPTGPGSVDPATERVILGLTQPAANHNGGQLAFGPDGYLYIGTGDGGGGGDPLGNGQNGQTLLGALLRLDADTALPYAVPADNPFVGNGAVRDEIWALGLRNPWRFSFDRVTGDLFVADVGQNAFEEVNFQPASSLGGENYGWAIMEGLHCFPSGTTCQTEGLTLPVHEYDHSQGCSVTGGYVYRGSEFPFMAGVYLFGDFCSGRIWGLFPGEGEARGTVLELGQFNILITSFGEDESGELYVLNQRNASGKGELYRLWFGLRAPTGLRVIRPPGGP